ncbi:MAG: 30S ribosomal protein S13 [Candidatus Nanohaloarchaea archaeon]|nr:30S ribosomal protein S13 [Candidatus Nanohaloarchaea archaeon]
MADVQEIVRIADTDVDGTKRIADAIQDVKGVGDAYANAVQRNLSFDPDTRIGALADDEREQIEEAMRSPDDIGVPSWARNRRKDRETGDDRHVIGADLDLAEEFDVRRYKEIGTYRGKRHEMGLPVRGQQTQASFRSGEKIGVERERVQEEAEEVEEGEGEE